MSDLEQVPEFAPSDPTDGRRLLEWQSMYDPEARKHIRREAYYLGIILASIPSLLLVVWLDLPKGLLNIPDEKYAAIAKYSAAWLSGTLGGTLYDLKWLYHSVARRLWHLDRRLWRVFTPHISGGLSFSVVALISSHLVSVFDARAVQSLSAVVGTGFLVGYFSDSAVAKLYEVAETLFGSTRSRDKGQPKRSRPEDSAS